MELKCIRAPLVAACYALTTLVLNTGELEPTSILPLDTPVTVLAPAVQTTPSPTVEEPVLAHAVTFATPLTCRRVVPQISPIVLPEGRTAQTVLSRIKVTDLPLDELPLEEGPPALLSLLRLLRHICSLAA